MRQQVSYDKQTEDFWIADDFGGMAIDLKTAKKLIESVRKVHPELLARPRDKSFYKQMKYYDETIGKAIFGAGRSCDKDRDGNCTDTRKKCPFKVDGGDGDYYCRKAALEEMMME